VLESVESWSSPSLSCSEELASDWSLSLSATGGSKLRGSRCWWLLALSLASPPSLPPSLVLCNESGSDNAAAAVEGGGCGIAGSASGDGSTVCQHGFWT
jgi:hypothetical protein